ncbi:MAG: hypothetical protein Q7S13_06680 [Candidatus Omnitrophota bacterium]|nr:hypothetical protein [Candidatus Omnitrophota bacterium]
MGKKYFIVILFTLVVFSSLCPGSWGQERDSVQPPPSVRAIEAGVQGASNQPEKAFRIEQRTDQHPRTMMQSIRESVANVQQKFNESAQRMRAQRNQRQRSQSNIPHRQDRIKAEDRSKTMGQRWQESLSNFQQKQRENRQKIRDQRDQMNRVQDNAKRQQDDLRSAQQRQQMLLDQQRQMQKDQIRNLKDRYH